MRAKASHARSHVLARFDQRVVEVVLRFRLKFRPFHRVSARNVRADDTRRAAVGVTDHGVTSLADLGVAASMAEVDEALKRAFVSVFGAVEAAEPLKTLSTDDTDVHR